MTFEHLLLTTDLSDEAGRAFPAAASLAQVLGARITLLHVVYDSAAAASGARAGTVLATPIGLTDIEGEKREAERTLATLAASLPREIGVTSLVVSGTDVARTIARIAQEQGADLVALSTHGRTGFRRLALGSIAEGVLRHASMPVLCFPLRASDPGRPAVHALGKGAHVLLATDLSDGALQALAPSLTLARELGGRVTVLHAVRELRATPHGAPLAPPVPSPELPKEMAQARASLEEQCAKLGSDPAPSIEVLAHADPATAIVEHARGHGVDLIALATHGRTGLERLALGSVAEHVLRHSPVPVLSFQRP